MKMNKSNSAFQRMSQTFLLISLTLFAGCKQEEAPADKKIKNLKPEEAVRLAKSIEATVTPQIADGLTLRLWGVDSLVADPVSIDIDDAADLERARQESERRNPSQVL